MSAPFPLPNTNQPTPQPTPGPDTPAEPYHDHIPALRELMPRTGGLPGVVYAQILSSNLGKSDREHWKQVDNQRPYTITGPRGSAECLLVCHGKPDLSINPDSTFPHCAVDEGIVTLTGLVSTATGLSVEWDPTPEAPCPEPATPKTASSDAFPTPSPKAARSPSSSPAGSSAKPAGASNQPPKAPARSDG